ncbi:MAG: hypothetical protein NTV08_10055 [Verrucomicrobia bacterium]|nr:hypothetical protein [Verrucomicrobiota bacterium]
MTLPLLKSALEPVVRRQKLLRLMLWSAAVWLVLGAIGFALWRSDLRGAAAIGGLGAAALIAWIAVRRTIAAWEPDYLAIARSVEQRHPDLHALLVTAVEQRADPATGKLDFLQQRVVADAVAEMRRRDCVQTVPGWQLAGATALQFAMLALLGFSVVALRPSSENAPRAVANRTQEEVTVTPGDVELERSAGLVVLAKFGRDVPSEAALLLSPKNAPAKRIPLVKNLDDPVFGGGVPEVTGDLSYRVEYAGRASREFTVKVFEHPRLDRADARVRFPEFAKLPEKLIADTRRVSAVQGTTLDVAFQLNKPVQSAQLVAKDGSVVPLRVDAAKAVVELKDFPVSKSAVWELKLKDADGRANKLAATFSLDALPNRRPELKIVTPKGDQRVSQIEEVAFRVDAWDDFGLRAAGISYSIGGGETKEIALARDSKPDEKLHLEHVLKLEEIGVKVDELVSWHVWAEDAGPDGKPRRTQSDIFFAEVRPFEEIYRPGDDSSGGQPPPGGGGGGEATKLAELQKEIITATWNLKRAEDDAAAAAPSEKYLKDEPVVKDSQEEALGMAQKLAEKIEEPKSAAMAATVTQEMQRALEQLTAAEKVTAPLSDALAAEQAAYNALLKLAAHEFRVQRNQQQGKGKGQQQGDKQRAQLDQLEMKDEKKRYEKQSEAEQPQNEQQKEQLAVLNRLKELAQRQQDINERVKELQNAIEEAKTEKEREEAKRQLKRLREEEQQLLADADELKQKMEKAENQSHFAGERKQLEQTRNDAQQAAESMQKGETSRALAEGKRAEQGFQKIRDDLRKKASGQFKDEMRQMRADARELAQKQEKIAEDLGKKPQEKERRTLDGSSPREKLAQEFEQQQKGLGDLREQMQRVSEQAEAAEPLLARQLYDTLRENAQAGTDETLKKAGELSRRGYQSQVKQFEEKARGEVEKVKKGVERAAESVLGDEAEALRQARAELDSLSKQLDREMAQARPDLAQNSKAGQGKGADSREGAGEKNSEPGKGGEAKAEGEKSGGDGEKKNSGGQADSQKGQGEKGDGQKGDSQKGQGQKGDSQQSDGQKSDGQKGDGQKGQGQKGEGQKGEGQKGQGQQGKGDGEGKQGGGKGSTGADGQPQNSQGAAEGQSGAGKAGAQRGGEQPGGKPAGSRLADIASSAGSRNGGNNAGGGGGGGLDGGPRFDQRAPLTGDGFVDWSDRLRNVEEMLDSQQLRREVAEIREAAKVVRSEFKREGAQPKWDIVKSQISKPLAELRNRVSEELARRESKESLVPIDRDPVPVKYSDRVRRYYEELGRSR